MIRAMMITGELLKKIRLSGRLSRMRLPLMHAKFVGLSWIALGLLGLSSSWAKTAPVQPLEAKAARPTKSSVAQSIPPAWEVLPIPRYADYGSPGEFLTLGRVAIVRRPGSPYQTVRDRTSNLAGASTIIEEELASLLKEHGVTALKSLPDDLDSYADFDTLLILGSPKNNRQAEKYFRELKLSFERWDDPRTPEDDFTRWSDLGREGYVLKAGRAGGKNIILLSGYDHDDTQKKFYGAGTFYALQSLRQLMEGKGSATRVKTAEIADKPLLAVRCCMTGFPVSQEQNWRDVTMIPRIKGNQNSYWYGSQLAEYNVEAASKFRHPWRPEQLKFFGEIGKFCREHFVTMVFCLNPDHYGAAWATAKTLDGKTSDPLHYDPAHRVEPGIKQMWAKAGYKVENDIDVVAAKFAQMNKGAGGGAMLTMMNEDDGFGLYHPADKKLFKTETGDPRQDAINYGRARAELLAALYQRVRALAPDSADMMPVCPPGSLVYQFVVERNEAHSREFLGSLGATLKERGLQDKIPLMTTGGGTAAEAITGKQIDDFRGWCAGEPMLTFDNNFPPFHAGAYETDPQGPRGRLQRFNQYPAGFRDKEIYKRTLGIIWNGMDDQYPLAWTQSQFMWNMLALEREKVNALALRKVCDEKSFPLVRDFYSEFDSPACYLPDDGEDQIFALSTRIMFPGKAWSYVFNDTPEMRRECQRMREKLAQLIPRLEAQWASPFEKPLSLEVFGWDVYNFCTVYLARGAVKDLQQIKDSPKSRASSPNTHQRDLLLEADEIQQRYFAGPLTAPGKSPVVHNWYYGRQRHLYIDIRLNPDPATPAEAKYYEDFWKQGLEGNYFEPLASIMPGQMKDGDMQLRGSWGAAQQEGPELFRTAGKGAALNLPKNLEKDSGRFLIRARVGIGAATLIESAPVTFSVGKAEHQDAVCQARWINWFLPEGAALSPLAIQSEKPVRVYAIRVYRERR